jgi:hypothetical protein
MDNILLAQQAFCCVQRFGKLAENVQHKHDTCDSQFPKGFKADTSVHPKLDVVVSSSEPRKKPPTNLETAARGGYMELIYNWRWFIALFVFLVCFPAPQAARTFSDIWISQWTARKNTWGNQKVLTEWEFYGVYVGFVGAFFLAQVPFAATAAAL